MRKKRLLVLMLAIFTGLWAPGAGAGAEREELIYRFDPALVLDGPRPPSLSADPNMIVVNEGKETSVHLQTGSQISPYLGAERSEALSAEELRLLPERKEHGALSDYRLEAGVGLFVDDKASLNLGYRFHNPPSLLEERRTDPLSLSGDVRISFDVKVPF